MLKLPLVSTLKGRPGVGVKLACLMLTCIRAIGEHAIFYILYFYIFIYFIGRHEGPVWQVSWAHPMFGNLLASCSYDRKVSRILSTVNFKL